MKCLLGKNEDLDVGDPDLCRGRSSGRRSVIPVLKGVAGVKCNWCMFPHITRSSLRDSKTRHQAGLLQGFSNPQRIKIKGLLLK